MCARHTQAPVGRLAPGVATARVSAGVPSPSAGTVAGSPNTKPQLAHRCGQPRVGAAHDGHRPGGGDTVAALNHAGVAADFSYVSTAGGAFLEWMEGKQLPGVEALKL